LRKIGVLLNDFEPTGDAACKKRVPNAVNLTAEFTGKHRFVGGRGIYRRFETSVRKLWDKNGGSEWESNPPATCRPAVLKITRSVLIGYENSLLYLILQPLTRTEF
jgi:hypothetical protein